MPKNEDGEFELILGNKQLLSVFFIVVILLGVFFTMGYIVGRNSAPVTSPEVGSVRPAQGPLVVDSPAPKEEPEATPVAAASSAPVETAHAEPPASKKPEAKKAEVKIEKKEEPKPEPPKAEAKKADAPKAVTKAAPVSSGQPVAGQTYLQLAAISKDQSDILVDILRKNGFKSLEAEVPEKPGIFRVLVGPIADGELNKTRADLQAKGFQGNAAIKRTF